MATAQSPKETAKKNYIDKCKKEFKAKMTNVKIADADLQEFCQCNAEKLLAKFTVEEVNKMDEIMAKGTVQQKQEVNEKITPVVMPCFSDLQTKIQ